MIARPTINRGSIAGLTARFTVKPLMVGFLLALSACKTTSAFPPRQDIIAITEAKPLPGDDILTDPAAGDRYDSAIEGWGDRVRAAGMRLCRFYQRTGMPTISCPAE